MKRKSFIILAILAVALWVVPATASIVDGSATLTFTTGDGTLSNVFSEPGKTHTAVDSATAAFSLVNAGSILSGEAGPYLKIVLTNTTNAATPLGPGTPTDSDVLSAVFWTSATFIPQTLTTPIPTPSGSATGTVVDGSLPSGTTLSNFWGYGHTASNGLPFGFGTTTAGNQGVSAVGLGLGLLPGATGFTPLATPLQNANNIDGIDYTLVGTGTLFNPPNAGHVAANSGPFVEPSVEVHLYLPAGTESYSFTDPEAWWGTASGNQVPIPPSVLLMGSGLLGLGLVGWRRRSQQA